MALTPIQRMRRAHVLSLINRARSQAQTGGNNSGGNNAGGHVAGKGSGAAHANNSSTFTQSPYRYWRINVTATDTAGNPAEMNEVGWLVSYYGLPLIVGTAGASSSFGSSTPDRLYDQDATTMWTSNTSTMPEWTSFDFGAGNSNAVIGVIITGPNSSFSARAPKNFDIQYSSNGTTWTTAWSVAGSTAWGVNEQRTFYNPSYIPASYTGSPWVASTYWRLTTVGNSQKGLAELKMRATVGGADQCVGGTPSAQSENGTQTAANAFDGNTTTIWSQVGTGNNWIMYQFAAPVKVGQISITARADGSASTKSPDSMYLEFAASSSGPWRRAWTSASGLTWTEGEVKNFTDPLYL